VDVVEKAYCHCRESNPEFLVVKLASYALYCDTPLLPVIQDTLNLAVKQPSFTDSFNVSTCFCLQNEALKFNFGHSRCSSNALPTVGFVKHIFYGPISVAKLEVSSNILVAGRAKGVDTSTIELGGWDFVLKPPKPYSLLQKHRPLHVVQYGT